MKIVLLNSLYSPFETGGAEKAVRYLAEGLQKRGHQPVVMTLSPSAARVTEHEIINGICVYRIPLHNSYFPTFSSRSRKSFWSRAIWHLRDRYNRAMGNAVHQILQKEGPDVLHTHNLTGFSVTVWSAAVLCRVPVVHTIHDYALICPRTTMMRRGQNCLRQCAVCRVYSITKATCSKQVSAVIGVSRFVLERHLYHGLFSEATNHVIYHPAPTFNMSIERDLVTNGLRLGYLGRLDPSKGVEIILDQLKSLLSSRRVSLCIAGTGDLIYETMLHQKAEGLPVTFLGYVPPSKLFRQIDLLIVPSRWHEPFGLVILEALAHGIPVVVSKRGGLQEVVAGGVPGFLFEPDDPASLPQIIEMIGRRPEILTAMKAKAPAALKERAIDQYLSEHLSVYASVMH